MTRIEDHRIYVFMSEPVRFVGLTIDEMGLFLSGFIGLIFNMGKFKLQLFWMSFGWIGVVFVRKFKKLRVGFNLKSYLIYYGIAPAPSKYWYPFHTKVWA